MPDLPASPDAGEFRTLRALAESSTMLRVQHTSSARDSARRRGLALADGFALLVAAGVVGVLAVPQGSVGSWAPLLLALPVWIVLNKLLGLYDRDAHVIHRSTLDELPRLGQSVVFGTALVILVLPLLDLRISRLEAVLFAVTAALVMPAARSAARVVVRISHEPERCLIVGSGVVASIVARKVRAHPEHGAEMVGYVDDDTREDVHGGLQRLGGLSGLEEICRAHRVDRIVIAFSSLSHEHLLDVIRASKLLGLKITVVPRLFEMLGHAVEIDQVQGMTLLGLRGLGRTRSSLAVKRAIDVIGAAVGLAVLLPVVGLIALGVRLGSPGPVLFAQERMGRGNRPFLLYKFRTMVRDADAMKLELGHLNEAEAPMFKIAHDPRVTPFGRFLRATSLDELPQLWNVLRGDMSLVGPRPLVPDENQHLIGWHRARLDLAPGLTGPWQVLGRTSIPFAEMVKLDYHYVADWSLWNDLKLLVRTVPVVFGRHGL